MLKADTIEKFINTRRTQLVLFLCLLILIVPVLSIRAEGTETYVCSKAEDTIYATLLENGYSPAGAAGILGNMSVENPDFEPDLLANGGYTYGLFQWSNTGDRMTNLKKWCNNRLLDSKETAGQLAFAIYELEGGDGIATRANEYLKTASDPEKAAMEFAVGFERCIGSTGNDEIDADYTGDIYTEHSGKTYQAMGRRMENAKSYYNSYQASPVNTDLALNLKGTPTAGIVAEEEEKMELQLLEILPVNATTDSVSLWLSRITCLVIGYAFGCFIGSVIIVHGIRKKKTFEMDKTLPGLTKVLKYVGIKEAAAAAAIDIGKFYLALGAAYLATGGMLTHETILWVGIGVIAGNDFPFWRRFQGSMGLLVTTVYLCCYMPIWGVECCLLGLVVALLTRSLPFGAMTIVMFAVPYAFLCKDTLAGICISFALALMLFRHYKFLTRFIDRNLLHAHYTRRRHRTLRHA